MTHSLVPFGMDPADEDAILFYFANPDEPEDWAVRAKWSRIRRFLNEEWDDRVSELERQLESFYEHGLLAWALKSSAAREEHATLFPEEPMPPNYDPGQAGSRPWVESLEKNKSRPTLYAWLSGLYEREAQGTTTGNERLVLDQVHRDTAPELLLLVDRFNKRMGWLRRKLEHEENERRNRERRDNDRPREPTSVLGSKSKRTHRRYGELPREPEVILRPRKRG